MIDRPLPIEARSRRPSTPFGGSAQAPLTTGSAVLFLQVGRGRTFMGSGLPCPTDRVIGVDCGVDGRSTAPPLEVGLATIFSSRPRPPTIEKGMGVVVGRGRLLRIGVEKAAGRWIGRVVA